MSKETQQSRTVELSDRELGRVNGGLGGIFVAAGDLPDRNGDRGVDLSDLNHVRNNFGAGG